MIRRLFFFIIIGVLLASCSDNDSFSTDVSHRLTFTCDTVHEMAKDEARHGAGFAGLLKRYFGK